MKQLSQQELDTKIDAFLKDRFAAHPELNSVKAPAHHQSTRESVVSRVKSLSVKFSQSHATGSRTLYQV